MFEKHSKDLEIDRTALLASKEEFEKKSTVELENVSF
jgi:hypothetical protein